MENPFIIIRCRRCGELLLADIEKAKTRKCHKCNMVNKLGKVVVEFRTSSMQRAQNALRYLKIPPRERDSVPYVLNSTLNEDKAGADSIANLFRKIKARFKKGIEMDQIIEIAARDGLDLDNVKKAIQKKIYEGEIIESKSDVLIIID
ncbi:MAG: hypothetical protein ACTSUE_10925 [Promethearchaeota archaeon]